MELDPASAEAFEVELLRKIASGDRACFGELFNRYSNVLFSTAYRILNQHSDAEDVLQDVFVLIWEKASIYDLSRGKPLTWAITLTRNKAIDRLRSSQRRSRLKEEMEEATPFNEMESGLNAADSVVASEKNQLVRHAIAQLTKDQRQAIELAFFSGLTQMEIAEKLGEPLGTIKARIRRGMLKLREMVEPCL